MAFGLFRLPGEPWDVIKIYLRLGVIDRIGDSIFSLFWVFRIGVSVIFLFMATAWDRVLPVCRKVFRAEFSSLG